MKPYNSASMLLGTAIALASLQINTKTRKFTKPYDRGLRKTKSDSIFSKDSSGRIFMLFKGALRKLMWDDVKQEQFIFHNKQRKYLSALGMKQYIPEKPTLATQLIAKVDQQETDLQACKSGESQTT